MQVENGSPLSSLSDLTPMQTHGRKILRFHGEQDPSAPTGSSVHYHESVRQTMYPGMSLNESSAALSEWYTLYLVPGAAHCAINTLEPNAPFPQTNLAVMIDWVENGNEPVTLNATVLSGDYKGDNGQICAWPLRPMWDAAGDLECVYHQAGIDTFNYTFDAYKLPLY